MTTNTTHPSPNLLAAAAFLRCTNVKLIPNSEVIGLVRDEEIHIIVRVGAALPSKIINEAGLPRDFRPALNDALKILHDSKDENAPAAISLLEGTRKINPPETEKTETKEAKLKRTRNAAQQARADKKKDGEKEADLRPKTEEEKRREKAKRKKKKTAAKPAANAAEPIQESQKRQKGAEKKNTPLRRPKRKRKPKPKFGDWAHSPRLTERENQAENAGECALWNRRKEGGFIAIGYNEICPNTPETLGHCGKSFARNGGAPNRRKKIRRLHLL